MMIRDVSMALLPPSDALNLLISSGALRSRMNHTGACGIIHLAGVHEATKELLEVFTFLAPYMKGKPPGFLLSLSLAHPVSARVRHEPPTPQFTESLIYE
jgi:hypothetical protein